MSTPYKKAATALKQATQGIALTGAGVSVESGISDFRSADGIWSRFDPMEYATLDAFLDHPDKVWDLWHTMGMEMASVSANAGHVALAAMEQRGVLQAVITQNFDGLHGAAGSCRVIEYHGNARRMVCLACGAHRPLELGKPGDGAPRCGCGEAMKPDVILFGEMIPDKAAEEGERLARQCDVMLIVGTSAQVYPVAQLPYTAKERGAFIIECNMEPTDFTEQITDVFLQGPASETLSRLLEHLSEDD
jgi:NAD-dependent deacetylase